jgi:hypothetical protein
MQRVESRPRIAALVAAIFITWAAAYAVAAEPTRDSDADLSSRVEQLEREIEDLRAGQPEDPGVESEIGTDRADYYPSRSWLKGMQYGIEGIKVGIHGFVNLEYIDAEKDGARGGDNSFDLHHANLFFTALLRENLRTHVEIEDEHGGDTIEVDQAYAEWGITDWLTFTGGQFYAPFGIERFVWYPPVNQLISRPLPFREIIPGNFYQRGIKLSGDLPVNETLRFTYEGSLSNGLGDQADTDRRDSRQTRDNNNSLALTGRVGAVLWPWLEFGFSAHGQRYNSTGSDEDLLFLGADAAARWQGFELRGEYVDAALERDGMSDLDQQGWYAQLSYTQYFDGKFYPEAATLVGRVDGVDLDEDVDGNDDRVRYSIGANVAIYNHFRFKAEYQFATEDGPDLDDDAFLAQMVIDF